MTFSRDFEIAILQNLLAQTTKAYEAQMAALEIEKELAQVTLASIGDGVITTGEDQRVVFLNPVAEKLTGISLDKAVGAKLDAVFRVEDESSGRPILLSRSRVMAKRGYPKAGGATLVRSDGERFAVEFGASPITSRNGKTIGLVIVFQDITEKRLMSLQLLHEATHDALTGALNRSAFDGILRESINSPAGDGSIHALAYFDLDQFKLINDTLGHLAGDRLLRDVAFLLVDEIPEANQFARLGGDEFAALLTDCSPEAATAFADRILSTIRSFRFEWESKSFDVTASVGLVPVTDAFETVDQLMSAADHACYTAKEKGRNRVQIYQRDDVEMVRRHDEMNWVVRIRETLEENRFCLYAQRILPLATTNARGFAFEVLVRVVEEDGRVLLPGDVIRAAERYGLMPKIDRWVIGATLDFLKEKGASFLDDIDFVSINLSGLSVGEPDLVDFIRKCLEETGVPGEKLCFEITETATIDNLEIATRLMTDLLRLRCRFALDDFGAGMSSFGYLKELPVRYLKIDGKFINDIVTDPYDRAMVEAIHQMARVIGIETIAECIASREIVQELRRIGVGFGQGYLFGFPQPIGALFGEPVARAR